MPLRIVRLGTPRVRGEGLRLGTVRRPPRGVRKDEIASRDFYDVWLPELAPSQALVSWILSQPITEQRWATFARKYRAEMKPARRTIELLAALSHQTNFAAGCYCDDEAHCHRSLLRELFREAGAAIADSGTRR